MKHPIFHTAYEIKELHTTHGGSPRPLVGVSIAGRLGVVYSQDGLNDTPAHHRLLLLRRQRIGERGFDQREHSGVRADALKEERTEGDGGGCRRAAAIGDVPRQPPPPP